MSVQYRRGGKNEDVWKRKKNQAKGKKGSMEVMAGNGNCDERKQ